MPHSRRRFALRSLGPLAALLGLASASDLPGVAQASDQRNSPTTKVVAEVWDSIVNIHGQKTLRPMDEGYKRDTPQNVNGMGTGVVIDQRGYILTNHHVVDGVKEIEVTLADKRTLVATLVAHDAKTDLALIKINASKKMQVVPVGTSSDLQIGEDVIAIGNAFGYEHTVTKGIISQLHREVQVSDSQQYKDLIQISAGINPGNSGGPLFNMDGELIGINVAVRAGAQAIGFTIPIDLAMSVASTLMATNNAWHGIVAKNSTGVPGKSFVVGPIDDESPAAKSGIRPGDVITTIRGNAIARSLDVERALLNHKAGEEIEVAVIRDRQPVSVNLVLAAAPRQMRTGDPDRIWDTVGLRLEPVPTKQFRDYKTHYHGGLLVTSVRAGGPAAKEGIRAGDVLVGMHNFETVSLGSIEQILNHPSLPSGERVKFWILRDDGAAYGTYFGHLNVTTRR